MIHIHEDDWGLRVLYPAAAWDQARVDVSRAAQAGIENRAADGVGWTDVYTIGTPEIDFTHVALPLWRAADALEALFPRVYAFTATAGAGFSAHDPLGSYEQDAYAFGDAACFVKLEPAGKLVKQIWFDAHGADQSQLAALKRAFIALNAFAPALIADYRLDAAGLIGDAEFLDAYFAALKDA